MSAPRLAAAVLSAAALVVPMVAAHEGFVPRVYADPAPGRFPTVCYGHRITAPLGTPFTVQQCMELLAQDLAKHGSEIAGCLPAEMPIKVRAAFTSFAFNVGSSKFCSSTLARKAKAGDLRGACAELSRWTFAGSKQLPGLVKRRADERRFCEEGLLRGLG
jgi:lysozyme